MDRRRPHNFGLPVSTQEIYVCGVLLFCQLKTVANTGEMARQVKALPATPLDPQDPHGIYGVNSLLRAVL